ncbi:unnamed protein product [Owenia fusiformis]|uniref:Uncharacterized protein n=1 Tax=Owenia fusiformis TaxID=6347 RepID=A0A8J1U5P5_OWEFU|nr:unnamed protein product [Owenia fusiformis]
MKPFKMENIKVITTIVIIFFNIVGSNTTINGQSFLENPNRTVELGHVNDTAVNTTDRPVQDSLQIDVDITTADLEPPTMGFVGACDHPNIELDSITYDCHNVRPEQYSCNNRCGSILEPVQGAYCSCDPGCLVHKDCCRDFQLQCPVEYNISHSLLNNLITEPYMECESFNGKQYKMVVQCLNGTRCVDLDRNWLDAIPVIDKATWVTYLNTNCAACNNVELVSPWPSNIICNAESILSTLTSLKAIQTAIENDFCFIHVEDIGHVCREVISTCPEDCANKNLVERCHNGSVQFVESSDYDNMMFGTYKNEYCLRCNIPDPGISCSMCSVCQTVVNQGIFPPFSFSLLMDINPKKGLKIGFNVNGVNQEFECDATSNCSSACKEGYDYNNDTCVHVFTPHTIIVNITFKIVESSQHAFELTGMMEDNFIKRIDKFAASDISYTMVYDNNILNGTTSITFKDNILTGDNITGIEYHNMIFQKLKSEYDKHMENIDLEFVKDIDFRSVCVEGMDALTCWDWKNATLFFERNYLVEAHTLSMPSETIMGIVTIVCLSISVVCMIIRLVLQIFVPVFHTFPGKLQFLMVLALWFASMFKLLGPLAFRLPDLCTAMGVLTHYFYLVTFTWMSIIALDMYLVFRAELSVASRGLKRLVVYSTVAFLLPGLIVATAGILDGVTQGSNLRPDYGVPVCMITNRYSLLLFFAGPLAVMIIFNIVMFSLTVHNLRKSWRDAKSVKTKKNENHFDVYIKLFLLMGFTWVFGFIAPFAEQDGLWYIFIILNASQGVFIFVASVCSRRVLRSLRCMKSTSKGSSYMTKSSSVRNSESVIRNGTQNSS